MTNPAREFILECGQTPFCISYQPSKVGGIPDAIVIIDLDGNEHHAYVDKLPEEARRLFAVGLEVQSAMLRAICSPIEEMGDVQP